MPGADRRHPGRTPTPAPPKSTKPSADRRRGRRPPARDRHDPAPPRPGRPDRQRVAVPGQDVDPANKKLRAAQKILFANLVEIGFDEIGYSQAEERFDPAVAQGARRYDVPGPGADAVPDPEGRPDAGDDRARLHVHRTAAAAGCMADGRRTRRRPRAGRASGGRGTSAGSRCIAARGSSCLVEKGDTDPRPRDRHRGDRGAPEVSTYWPRKWRGSVFVIAPRRHRGPRRASSPTRTSSPRRAPARRSPRCPARTPPTARSPAATS